MSNLISYCSTATVACIWCTDFLPLTLFGVSCRCNFLALTSYWFSWFSLWNSALCIYLCVCACGGNAWHPQQTSLPRPSNGLPITWPNEADSSANLLFTRIWCDSCISHRLNNPARADLTGDPIGSALWSQLAGDAVKWPGNVPVTSCWDQTSTKQIVIAVKDFPFGQKMSPMQIRFFHILP